MNPPWLATSESNFHCYALSEVLVNAAPAGEAPAVLQQWLEGSLGCEWRFVCTMGGQSTAGLMRSDKVLLQRYVDAAIQYWPAIEREVHRFGPILDGLDIIHHWHTLTAALLGLGVPPSALLSASDREPRALIQLAERGGAA